MRNYLVIGNPIEHSLSPELHNYWIKKNNLNATYTKLLLEKKDLPEIFKDLRNDKINGFNVTIPFKQEAINYVDQLSTEAKETKSVNTIIKKNNIIFGYNTDIYGFELAIRHAKFNLEGKKILILGAGGVTPSIIYALNKLKVSEILLTNRTKEHAEKIKNKFKNITILEWGKDCNFDMVINATSLGLKKIDKIDFNYENRDRNTIFYDVIYNPKETNFLKEARKRFYKSQNGKMMFIYQAHQAFTLWHNFMPKIDDEVLELLDK